MKYLTLVLSLLMLSTSAHAIKLNRGDEILLSSKQIVVNDRYIIKPDCTLPLQPESDVTVNTYNSRIIEGRYIYVTIDGQRHTCKVKQITII